MKFEIKWKYSLENGGGVKIHKQTIKLNSDLPKGKVEMPSFCMGVYIANLFNACKVDSPINDYLNTEAYTEWQNIVGETYQNLNKGDNNVKYILYDSIAYPAFCIFNNIRTMLEEISDDGSYINRIFSRSTREILGELVYDLSRASNDFMEVVQSCIDEYIEQFNELMIMSREEFNDDYYEKLCKCLRKYNESEMIKQYLAKQEEKGRCFATFIEDETNNKYISFSGFVDAIDSNIITWLNRNKKESSSFVEVATAICSSMGAEFVPINFQTRRYLCVNYSPFTVEQWLSLDDIIRYNLKGMKKYYSCCERKIFGRFKDKTPNGKLYVKMKICGECSLGLYYQCRNGNSIVLYDGLEC